ncbi:MAG: MerR family transcriptional regulator [Hyphomicrobiaceae bacterium]|nr:MerR family transcriptional regulator [Hyphomicrobiaceae bacterium]
MSKSAEAFRTISEVADELEVPKHVLRFWEQKFPQIRPMKRGGGRRYYRPEDLDLLRGIRHLLHLEGYTIRGVQKILRLQGVDEVKRCWAGRPAERPAPAAAAESPPRSKRKQAPPAPADRAAVGLPRDVLRSLKSALSELEACRRLLAAPSGDQQPWARRPER